MSFVEVKYAVANSSLHATEPKKVMIGSAGYDLFAAVEKILILICVTLITIELKMEIPSAYFGKIYRTSSLLEKYFVSCDTGVIDSNFCDTVLILMTKQ